MQQLVTENETITYDYDSLQDMLYILFEPVTGSTFYEDVPEIPGVMRRYSMDDERLVGISVHDVENRLPSDTPQPEAIRQLARSLVEQLG